MAHRQLFRGLVIILLVKYFKMSGYTIKMQWQELLGLVLRARYFMIKVPMIKYHGLLKLVNYQINLLVEALTIPVHKRSFTQVKGIIQLFGQEIH